MPKPGTIYYSLRSKRFAEVVYSRMELQDAVVTLKFDDGSLCAWKFNGGSVPDWFLVFGYRI